MKLLLLIAALCSIALKAQAAAGFVTFGGTSGSFITTGYNTAPGSSYSMAFWYWSGGSGQGSFGDPIDMTGGTSTNFIFYHNNSPTNIHFQQVFSTTAGDWGFNLIGTGNWEHVCLTYNNSSVSNNPIVYINGSSVSVTRSSTPVGTAQLSSKNIILGNNFAANAYVQAKMADYGFWNNTTLTANECKAMALGSPAIRIRNAALSFNISLTDNGGAVYYADWGPNHVTQTVTGTVAANTDPPIQPYPRIVYAQ